MTLLPPLMMMDMVTILAMPVAAMTLLGSLRCVVTSFRYARRQ